MMASEAMRAGLAKRYPALHCSNLGLMVNRLNPQVDPGDSAIKDAALMRMESFRMKAQGYEAALERFRKGVAASGDCEIFEVETNTRLLLGTGNASVFEFGCHLNHPWGVPFIPGSSLKGLLSSWLARQYGDKWRRYEGAKKADAQVELFGGVRNLPADPRSYVGTLVFHDAWLVPSPAKEKESWFVSDIVTPHHMAYYQGKSLPSGMEDPVPAKMAALRPGLRFRVMIQGPEDHRALAKDELIKALEKEGIGGKTAVGYGRFDYLMSSAEVMDSIASAIREADTADEFSALYARYKNISAAQPVFMEVLHRFEYGSSMEKMWKDLKPLDLLHRELEAGSISSLKELNARFKEMKKSIGRWQAEVAGGRPLPKTSAGRTLFDLMVTRWPTEITDSQASVVNQLRYGWEEVPMDADSLAAHIDSNRSWPPLKELLSHLEKGGHALAEDDLAIISMMVEEKLP